MLKIGIIGGGFSGTMTAVQLISKTDIPLSITIINEKETLNKGFAYSPYSKKHILNVITEKMSAFPDKPHDFLDWVMHRNDFSTLDRTFIANSFLPRSLYGEYLVSIWENAKIVAREKGVDIVVIDDSAVDLDVNKNNVEVTLKNDIKIIFDHCVITTGNQVPRNPTIANMDFYNSKNYFQNPWSKESVLNIDNSLPVLIIGNGLSMVDTVFGLLENGFKNKIYSISPNGFNILTHRHHGLKYLKLEEEIQENMSLYDIVKLIHKHIKIVREYGVSAEPVIDSIRPYTQKIWKRLSDTEKKNIYV